MSESFKLEATVGSAQVLTRYGSLDCEIRRLTITGACIELVRRSDLPFKFELRMLPSGRVEKAQLISQSGRTASVRFAS